MCQPELPPKWPHHRKLLLERRGKGGHGELEDVFVADEEPQNVVEQPVVKEDSIANDAPQHNVPDSPATEEIIDANTSLTQSEGNSTILDPEIIARGAAQMLRALQEEMAADAEAKEKARRQAKEATRAKPKKYEGPLQRLKREDREVSVGYDRLATWHQDLFT
ncbi:hypothetical protein H0H87_001396 [Tephrocybe sp. NHM501043]|nr:hypothetical protein H0H87_001396 [Tephrocybe sp. NHM501043]